MVMPTIVKSVSMTIHTPTTSHTSVSRIVLPDLLQMLQVIVLRVVITNTQTKRRTNASRRVALALQETLLRKTVSSVVETLRTLITPPTHVSPVAPQAKLGLSTTKKWEVATLVMTTN
jgi:hypothetical protein